MKMMHVCMHTSVSKSTSSPPNGSASATAVSFKPRQTRQMMKKQGMVINCVTAKTNKQFAKFLNRHHKLETNAEPKESNN